MIEEHRVEADGGWGGGGCETRMDGGMEGTGGVTAESWTGWGEWITSEKRLLS